MKRIEVKLALPVVAPLLDVIKELADGLRARPAGPAGLPDVDLDFSIEWSRELVQGQGAEIDALLGLFGDEFFKEGVVAFDDQNAELIVRACAAIRLRLRETSLRPMGDEVLETGDVDLGTLDATVRRAFMCYLFLATVQELIIQHLDEGILGG